MKKTTLLAGAMLLSMLSPGTARAQLNTNPDKFLGNITTRGQVNGGGYEYKTKWNQLTCENETKWSSVQGGGPNSWNWGGADNAYNYCKNNGLLFKFHCLVWGAQYPSWIENLTPEERYKAVVNWMDGAKKRYPDLKMFDVVNEAVQGHQGGTHWFEECLGGKGVSGYDWIIKAFELAHERWPDAILIYNDYNTFQWQRQQFKDLVTALRDYGAPIDAYGCQSHDLTNYSLNSFKQAMDEIQNQLKMPMYSTEYDIGTIDDQLQLRNYSEQIPYMWEKEYFAGLTLWGSTYGATWTSDRDANNNQIHNGHSGILNRNKDNNDKAITPYNRPAYDWLVEYMKSDKAKTAKSPFPGMKKQVDLYIKPMQPRFSVGESAQIDLRARMVDKKRKIERIDFYANNQLYCTLTEAPWVVDYTPAKMGNIPLKAILVADDGQEYTRYGSVTVVSARAPYGSYSIPGTFQAENFDKGVEGSAFHDVDYTNSGNQSYRTDCGVDISSGNSSKVISHTETGEWVEYTVNVKNDGYFSYEITTTSGVDDAVISLSVKTDSGYVDITDKLSVPCFKRNAWTKYQAIYGRTIAPLTTGKQVIRLNIDKGGAYIDKMTFKALNVNEDLKVNVEATPGTVFEADTTSIKVNVEGEAELKNVLIYINKVKQATLTEAPYELQYIPTTSGINEVMAFATDVNDQVSEVAICELKVEKKRIPFKDMSIPGDVEAEDFDKMGEGFSFHDSDKTDDGKANYRSDNEGIDIAKTSDNRYVIMNTQKDEWMDYTVNVTREAFYDVALTVSTNADRGQYQLFLLGEDGEEIQLCSKRYIAAYKDLNNYKTVKFTTTSAIPAGKQTIRLKVCIPFNIDKMTFTVNEETGVEEVLEASRIDTYAVYSVDGKWLGNFRASSDDDLSAKTLGIARKAGTYVVKNTATGESKTLAVK